MVPSEREDTPARKQIQIAVAIAVKQPLALPADVALIEADRANGLYERGIYIPLVQLVLSALLSVKPVRKLVL